jgi:uncharacterized membrane protein (DUF2068 family)
MQSTMSTHHRGLKNSNRWLVLIGGAKLLKALAFIALGFGALHLVHRDLLSLVTQWIVDMRFDPESHAVNFVLEKVAGVSPHKLRLISYFIFGYAAVDVIEGTGLILGKAWAEYFTLIVSAALLPWEFFEIIRHPNWPKAVFTLLNILVVVYLALCLERRLRARRAQKLA